MATKSIAWTTGNGNILLTYTGKRNGTIQVSSDPNNLGSARSQVISVETLNGAITRNITINQAACPVPVGTVLSYSYTGSYQEVTLPPGSYKLQCWGAQGGSNEANSSYGITAQSGGKGGYSEGVLTLVSATKLRIYVGGQGTSSGGGYNGGGSTSATAQYNSGNEFGYSKMGGGGGATDIRLSDGALLSRMIVAGGGGGGAMCYRKKTETVTSWTLLGSESSAGPRKSNSTIYNYITFRNSTHGFSAGDVVRIYVSKGTSGTTEDRVYFVQNASYNTLASGTFTYGSYINLTIPSGTYIISIQVRNSTGDVSKIPDSFSATLERKDSSSSTTTDNNSQSGYVGGGTTGGGYSSTYKGNQNGAGTNGSFGQGANQSTTNYRYCSGAGGGGWYGGGGGSYSDSYMTYCKYSGGGSGFVNTAASAGNRPSGYTGLELDSGITYAGDTSFPNTAGTGNETGHSGSGYAKITRLS